MTSGSQKKRFLIIDDDEAFGQALSRSLQRKGYVAEVARDLDSAPKNLPAIQSALCRG